MNCFEEKLNEFYNDFGMRREMVLSTSLNDKVSSRMVSVIVLDGNFCFQTDRKLKKYHQIKSNQNVALCIDNISIEGICIELGPPVDNDKFCRLYKKYYPNAYEMYSKLEDEVLFAVKPVFIQKWLYENGMPFIEIWDIKTRKYEKKQYKIKE